MLTVMFWHSLLCLPGCMVILTSSVSPSLSRSIGLLQDITLSPMTGLTWSSMFWLVEVEVAEVGTVLAKNQRMPPPTLRWL